MITLVVSLSLLGAGDPGEQKGIDFPQKSIAPAVTPGIPPTPSLQDRIDFFEKKIRPLLIEHCYECHSADAPKLRGGLLLNSRAGWMRGGDSGPAIVPGEPEKSLLIDAVRYQNADLAMPPQGKLPQQSIDALVRWVKMGAPDPREDNTPAVEKKSGLSIAEGREFWSYRPPRKATPPAVEDEVWPRSQIDHFVLSRLEANGLRPAADADRATLARRVYFDLVGLPPTPEELAQFLEDDRSDSLERLVDELLGSPRYGERWGRHWLDLARFAESVVLRGLLLKNAWRYRDYVIETFNEDVPFDQLIREHIAGDLIPGEELAGRQRRQVATTFLTMGDHTLESQDKKQLDMDVIDEQLDVIGKAFLGQTIACARCHDHKFDPIPTRDYYALAGILKGIDTLEHSNVSGWVELPLPLSEEEERVHTEHADRVAALQKDLEAAAEAAEAAKETKPNALAAEMKTLKSRLEQLKSEGPQRPMVLTVRESKPSDIPVHVRGSAHNLGDIVPRGVLQVTLRDERPEFSDKQSGRFELANWIASAENPLTARVFVNRAWHWLFGEGIVRTPDNFGTTGQRPTHPELLDWLAVRFVEEGWSVKWLVREIVLSRVYTMSSRSANADETLKVDPENRLLWRRDPRQLEAECLRDAMLSASGRLRFDMGGRTYPAKLESDYDHQFAEPLRSVYVPVFRNALPEIFEVFNGANPSMVTGKRDVTTVTPQALFLLNHPFVLEQSEETGRRISRKSGGDIRAGVSHAYALVVGRRPTQRELERAERFVSEARTDREKTWAQVAHALFNSMDFRFVR